MSDARPSAFRRASVLVGAVLLAATFVAIFSTQITPREARAQSLNLSGTWKVVPGETPNGASPLLDDSAAPQMRVPGGYARQGFTAPECWLRRHFEVSPNLQGKPLFLLLGDTRSGIGRIFVNGSFVGQTNAVARGTTTEASGLEGWSVPAGLVHAGDNVLAVHFSWSFVGADGINHPEALLGPADLLQPHYEGRAEVRHAIQYGAAALMLFLLALFASVLAAEWETSNRRLYIASMQLLLAATIYMGCRAGVFFKVPIDWPWHVPAIYLSVLGVTYTQPEFIIRYFLGENSRFLRFHRRLCSVFLLALIISFAGHLQQAANLTFAILCAYTLIPIVFLAFISLRQVFRGHQDSDVVMFSALIFSLLSGGADTFAQFGLLNVSGLFPLYPMGISASAILGGVVLIADFTKVAFDNKTLSQSLTRTNAHLEEALVEAQEATRLKSEFVANVSHELRTPLNSVLNIPEGLLESFRRVAGVRCRICTQLFELDAGETLAAGASCPACEAAGALVNEEHFQFQGETDSLVSGLGQVYRSGKHLLNLINDVLDFSKLEAGRAILRLEEVDVAAALQNVIEILEPVGQPRRVRMKLEVEPGPRLTVDAVNLSQIFINLVGNALKFSPEGAEVKVRAELRTDHWRFSVRDEGIGIARENHALIFESFRQVDGSNTRKFGGTGLGLAITRKMAEVHGGRIWVESEYGLGSTFFVELPIGGPQVESNTTPIATPDFSVGTILIVDDERFAVENLRAALGPLKHRVHGVLDPSDLDRALVEVKPDLLILDVLMPGLSGLDVLRMLNERKSRLPVLVSSAYHANREIVEALGAAWLAKPWRSAELRENVTRLLSNGRMAA